MGLDIGHSPTSLNDWITGEGELVLNTGGYKTEE